jgi:hypothetical protein
LAEEARPAATAVMSAWSAMVSGPVAYRRGLVDVEGDARSSTPTVPESTSIHEEVWP